MVKPLPANSTSRTAAARLVAVASRRAGEADPVGAHGDGPVAEVDDVVAADEAGDEGGARAGEDLEGRALLLDPAVIHQDDEIGERQRLVLRMGDVHEGDAEAFLQPLQLAAHADAQEGIERRKRLVEEQRRGLR